MGVVVHLSDLHLLSGDAESDRVLECLLAALEADRGRRERHVDLVVITGDVFDTAGLEPGRAVREMLALHRNIQHVLGRGSPVPTVVVPGNHDRRRLGLFGPHRTTLFDALREAAPPELWVHGGGARLAEVVPHALHGLPIHLVAYDSSFLPTGYLSAGGNVRSEDLLGAVASIEAHPEWPLVLLLHHHLVPTPVTDTGPIETHGLSKLAHTSLHRILPVLVTHADREELTMTAMGAGSVLSLLHSFERPVLVLHGHKHIASARKLEGLRRGEGDVILASAGSAATAQRWSPRTSERWSGAGEEAHDPVRIWPSFNVVEIDDDGAVSIETVSFGWKGRSAGQLVARPLVWAARQGARWQITPTSMTEPSLGPTLRDNDALLQLRPSTRHGHARFDSHRVRRVAPGSGRAITRYREVVDGLPDGTLEQRDRHGRTVLRASTLPTAIEVPLTEATELDVHAAIPRTLEELRRAHGAMAAPFPSVGLFNRYPSARASLTLEGLGAQRHEAFASLLDLGSGRERPLRLHRLEGEDRVVVALDDCPARTLLRVHWPASPSR